MSHRTSVRLAALAVASTLTGSVLAQTTYTNAGSGLWNDPLNWSAGVPTNLVQAILPSGTPGTITLGAGGFAGYVTVNDNYSLTGGTLTVGSAAALSNTNGSIYVADGFALTLANDSLVAGTSDGRIRISSLTTPPTAATGNGIVRLGTSQSGLATASRVVLGGGSGNGVIVEFGAAAAFGGPNVLLDNGELGGGNFGFAGLDQKFDGTQPLENRNEIVLLRYTGTPGALTLPNPTWGSSPFRYLFVENAGSTFTLSGEMKRRDGNNQRINTVASWNGTTVQVGAPNPGVGNPDYLLDSNTTVGLTGNKKANGIGVAAIKGKIEVYKANQDTSPFATSFGGSIGPNDTDLHMGLLTGVRGQDAADVNAVSQVEFFNQSQGGAIADGNGVSQYRYSSLINESARYQVPRGQSMVPLEIITNANTNVTVSGLGTGVAVDARGDIIKKGPGTLTIISGRSDSPVVAGGVAWATLPSPPPGYPPATNYEGLIDVQDGGVVFKTTATVGPSVDTLFDGGTGSTDEARTGVVNYKFAAGTSLKAEALAGAQPIYNFKSDVTLGTNAGDVVTFEVTTGGDVAGKGVGFGSGLAAKPNPALNWNGTLKKTGAGLLVFGGGAGRVYNIGGGAALQVDAGRARFDVGLNAPTMPVANNGTLDLNAGTSSFGTISGTGTTTVAAGATLNLQGSANAQAALNVPANANLAVDIAALATFDAISLTGSATLGGNLQVALVGAYEPAHTDTFTVLTSGGVSGTFANTNAWGLIPAGAGKAFLPDYTGGLNVVLKEFAEVGDLDFDGVINNQDIAPFVAVLTGTPPVAPSPLGFAADVNADGVVNNQDIGPFVALLTAPRPLSDLAGDPDFAPLLALVPEPASVGLLALGGLALRRRRRC